MAWVVYDNGGRGDGIGSRYFNVSNGVAGGTTASPVPGSFVTEEGGNRTARLNHQLAPLAVDNDGTISLEVGELSHIELPVGATSGHMLGTGQQLPIGSSLQDGVFYWQLGPGFLGDYVMVFERPDGTQTRVRVRVQPKMSIINQSAQ